MMPSTIVRALTTPAFERDHFTATQWSTAEDKAKFANALMMFIAHATRREEQAEEKTMTGKKHGTPVRRKGWVRPAADARAGRIPALHAAFAPAGTPAL